MSLQIWFDLCCAIGGTSLSTIALYLQGLRIALTDGAFHAVDSSELAFKLASVYAFRAAYSQAAPTVLEPVMMVEVTVPGEFQVGNSSERAFGGSR